MKNNIQYETIFGSLEIKRSMREPYSSLICSFLDDLSKYLRKDFEAKQYSDIISFAFWCRKKNIQKHKENFLKSNAYLETVGRGLVFHIAPSNIPINFMFSFVFGLLAGNSNIVRVPSKKYMQIEILVRAIEDVINSNETYSKLRNENAMIKYSRDSDLTHELSMMVDARMIWGGNETIHQVKSIATKPRCKDIVFADRNSYCILNLDEVSKLSDSLLEKLVIDFYNDTFVVDQNACSSPNSIFYINYDNKAKNIFFNKLKQVVEKKYDLEYIKTMEKELLKCMAIADIAGKVKVNNFDGLVNTIEVDDIKYLKNRKGKFGLFYEYQLDNINQISKVIDESTQTITYFGVDPQEILETVKDYGVDRIVKIGQGLEIDVFWDGYDLITELSRKIDIR